MTWLDRTAGSIIFTSPNGNTFDALWIKNNRSVSKKLGIFELPDRPGAIVQDLDLGAFRYPLTFLFDGPDNDIEAERFVQSISEKGEWSVVHPTKGSLSLQLVSIVEEIDPVDDGNFTRFTSQWIQPNNQSAGASTPQIAQKVTSGIQNINSSSFDQIVETTKQNKAIETSGIKNSADFVSTAADINLLPLAETSQDILSQFKSIQRGIQDTISQELIEVDELAGQIQNLIEIPALVTNEANSRVTAYSGMIEDLISFSPAEAIQDTINQISVIETAIVSVLAAFSGIGTTSDLKLRNESIGLIETIFDQFEISTNYLDSAQELFDSNDIDIQYFSQSSSFSDTLSTIMNSAQFLLQKSFDLAIEKRFFLENDQAPIITTIQEYGDLGENDSNFDLFIDTNKLKGNDILLMKAGREVVVYV